MHRLAVFGSTMVAMAFSVAADSPAGPSRAEFKAVADAPADEEAFNRLLATLPVVTFDDEGTPHKYYVWEGDLLYDREQVRALILSRLAQQRPARGSEELVVMVRPDGEDAYWRPGDRAITYAVDCASFPSAAACATVTQAMRAATRAWTDACTSCGLSFRQVTTTGTPVPNDSAAGPRFVVRYTPQNAGYIAVAFFPGDPAFKRYVYVAPSYFQTSFDRTGVLRHELGHVLGYRHEHIRDIAGCYYEDNRWRPLTAYDPHSVMHYFCGSGGTMSLSLTASDRAGHRAFYGRR